MSNNELHVCIHNLGEATDRSFLKQEFGRIGEIRKIYIATSGKFAKVYYQDPQCCKIAANHFVNNLFGWIITIDADEFPFERKVHNNKEDMEEDDFYVDIFGRPVEVFIDEETNDMCLKLKHIERTGFRIFKFDDYRRLRECDKNEIVMKEFELSMLGHAENYLLKNVVTCIDEKCIVNTINRARSFLGIEYPEKNSQRIEPRRTFENSHDNNNISIRTDFHQRNDLQNFRPNSRQNENNTSRDTSNRSRSQNRSSISASVSGNLRPPHGTPSTFYNPSQSSRSTGPPNNNRNPRENRRDNNYDRPRQQNQQQHQQNNYKKANNDDEEFWDAGASEQKRDPSSSRNNRQKNYDTMSQASDSSSVKKKSLIQTLEEADEIAKVTLVDGETYNVRITYAETEKPNICWVQECKSSANIDDMLLEIDDAISGIKTIQDVTTGQLAIAEYEGAWCRCRVMNTSPLKVLFIDFGNKENVDLVKELPEKFRKTPALASRMVINKNRLTLEVDMELKVKITKKYEDGTYVVELENNSSPNQQNKQNVTNNPEPKKAEVVKENDDKPNLAIAKKEVKVNAAPQTVESANEEKHYFDIPAPMMDVKNGDKVMLIGLVGNKFAVKTRESAQRSKEILEYIKGLNKSDLLLSSVKEGQLVLCSKDGLPNMCRGIVKSKETSNVVKVEYLDYCGKEELSIKSLRNVDEYLATEQRTLLFTREMALISSLTEQSMEYIDSLIEKKQKCIVVITEDEDFDLQIENDKFLSQQIMLLEKSQKEAPVLVPATSTPQRPPNVETRSPNLEPVKTVEPVKKVEPPMQEQVVQPITYNDMPFITTEVGSTASFICYTINDTTELTLIATTDESVMHMETISDLDIQDKTPFEPEVMDMVVVLHKLPEEEEPVWYRAVVLDKEAKGYALSCVDFGSQIVASSKDIRRFPPNLKDIPILGILCSLKNIPNNSKTLARIKELIKEGEELTAVVKEFNEDELKYLIEVPEVYETLHKEGLC